MTADTPTDELFRKFQIQKFDVKRMVPAVNMTVEADVTALMERRAMLNANRTKEQHITVTHLVNKAACDVVMDYPVLYSSFDGRRVISNPELILNVPVDIENHVEYLVIRRPNEKSLDQLIAESSAEFARIQRGEGNFRSYVQKLMRAPVWTRRLITQIPGLDIQFLRTQYGNFPISNFGSFGVDRGAVVIAKPMIAALCFGRIADRLVMREDQRCESVKILALSITFDHRPLDGAYVGRFMSALKQRLEAPERLLGKTG